MFRNIWNALVMMLAQEFTVTFLLAFSLFQVAIASIEENSHLMGLEAAQLLFRNIQLEESAEREIFHHIKVPCKLLVNG